MGGPGAASPLPSRGRLAASVTVELPTAAGARQLWYRHGLGPPEHPTLPGVGNGWPQQGLSQARALPGAGEIHTG